jgi:hypothetical protein
MLPENHNSKNDISKLAIQKCYVASTGGNINILLDLELYQYIRNFSKIASFLYWVQLPPNYGGPY